jgi:pimeloyl-ACP methyl ester carboxylesterase
MPYLTINDNDIFYTEHGNGQPVILLHGRSASGACWDWHIERLRHRCRVIAFDSVNHGHSSNSPRDVPEPDRVAELEGVLTQLDIDRPVLVGQSQGAVTTLRWATRHPGRAAAIVITGMGWPLGPGSGIPRAPLRDGLFVESRNFAPEFAAAHPEILRRYSLLRSTATTIETTNHPRPGSPEQNEWFEESFGTQLAQIRTPVRIAVGDRDFAYEAAISLAKIIPGAELTVLHDGDHSAYLQVIDDFLEVVDAAIADA